MTALGRYVTTLRLAIVSTHPIQYYAPIFKILARSQAVQPKVFFTWSQTANRAVADSGFGQAITWDIPLLEGYEYEFIPNVATRPGVEHFRGVQNPGLVRAIESWGADAVLVFAWNMESHLRALRYFKNRIPVFFRGDSTLLDRSTLFRTIARRIFLSWVYRHIDVAIAVGANNRDYFRWCGVPEKQIAFAPHAVDTRRFSDDAGGMHEARCAQWRSELRIPAQAPTVLYAGKLQPIKDPLLLLDAYLQCGAEGHLVFVGSGELESELRARVQGRSDVHFLPFQNQQAMPAVYRLGNAFVLPSKSETWGLALNEAMASGRPIIASDRVGGARDLVNEGVNGWMFKAGNREQLSAIIRNVLTCGGQSLVSAGEAAQRDSERWSAEAAAAGIEAAVLRFA
jgi:glycosyltransferase involved in cell wall biosynthesis